MRSTTVAARAGTVNDDKPSATTSGRLRMKVSIKEMTVDMELKNNGMELDVSDTDGTHLGDLVVTRTKLVWCKGKTSRANGKEISWHNFIKYMESL
jgi:hypothetical protein